MKKRILSLILALLISAALLPISAAAEEYTVSDWARAETAEADRLGLIPESMKDSDLTRPISRAEFAALALRVYETLSGQKAEPADEAPFDDCGDEEVLKAYGAGIVNGTGGRLFEPDKPVDREQAATMLTRAYKKTVLPCWSLAGDSSFEQQFKAMFDMPEPFADDASISDWARESVYFLAAKGIVSGIGGNVFAPNNETDEQAASGYATATYEQAFVLSVRVIAALKPDGQGVYILYTSDVHCGVDKGFGFAGLQQTREQLEAQGYATILVDNGDAVQGEAIGTLSKGGDMTKLMNVLKYDVAIPGDHEFDYGMQRFMELAEMADFPYISCNFNREGELVFEPYVIKEAAGMKIAFVGVTTPNTLTQSTPAYFKNESGEFIYGFMQDATGEALYQAVQKAVDDARAEGADYVYILGHLGNEPECRPWTYEEIIANTNGIDVLLDGHRHDTGQATVKNKDGKDVFRSACGTKLGCIGYSRISAANGIEETGIWSWTNSVSAPELLGIDNEAQQAVTTVQSEISELLKKVVANATVELTINDPEAKQASGQPLRMVRRAETNLGDFCADVMRSQSGADIAVINGGGVRVSINKGDITYGDIISVFPFGNELCTIEATGQQILDALEWGARSVPSESGAFLQVSGMSYEIDVSVPNPCKVSETGMCTGIEGARRVKNVKVGGQPIDPEKTYIVGGINYTLIKNGDGFTAFDGCRVLQNGIKLDNMALIDYIVDTLGGTVGAGYEDPRGEGRITILGA